MPCRRLHKVHTYTHNRAKGKKLLFFLKEICKNIWQTMQKVVILQPLNAYLFKHEDQEQ